MNEKWPNYEVKNINIEGSTARLFNNEEVTLGKITM